MKKLKIPAAILHVSSISNIPPKNSGEALMNNIILFTFFSSIVLFLFAGISANAQSNTALGNYPNGKVPTIFQTDTPGDSCIGSGLEQHDGPLHSNGYTQFTDSVRFVIKFHPTTLPWVYTKFCAAFCTIGGGATSKSYDIVVYDTLGAGGSPGSLLQVIPNQTVSGIPNFPAYTWNSSVINIPVSAILKAVYIGVRFKYIASQPFYCMADELSSTAWPGYVATNTTGIPVWETIQTQAGNSYKCMAMRTFGHPVPVLLCEQFANATFPPDNWDIFPPGPNQFWTRATQSGYGIGIGSARWDCWNAPTGTRQTLFTPQFVPGITNLYFDVAYQPFGNSQDSLIIAGSTDGGTTWTSIARFGPTQLSTVTGATSPFVPTASQWKHLAYVVPQATNKLQFQGYSGFGDCLYIDSICNFIVEGVNNNGNNLPIKYSLSQNYPNPFNPTTVISYGLPKAGNVKLVVFDVLGREVKTLVDEFRQAGNYNVTFDGTNLASGIYFYSITSGDFVQTKKMLMVK